MPALATITKHESEHGSWKMAARAPHPALAGAISRYVDFTEHSPTPLRRREVAQDQVTLIINFGPPLIVGGPTLASAGRASFVAPINASYAITEFTGVSTGMQLDMTPFAARALFGLPMRELEPLVVDLDGLLGRDLGTLVERLQDAPGADARFGLLDQVLGRRLEAAARPAPDAAWAWRRLRETGGRLEIGALAAELGCSRRHLVERFRDQVGPAPKTVARIMRFQRVLRLLGRDDGTRLTELANDCGYYDQAHLNRDFRELAGTTPNAYLASRLADGSGVAA